MSKGLNAVKEEKSKKGLLSYHYKVSFEEYLVADRSKKHISLIKSILSLLNSKSRNTVLLLKHGVWWVFSSKTLLDFKETLITLLVVRPKLEWASNYEMKEEGHLLQTKESRELLSWISSKEKFMPHDKTFTTISDERWAIIQTRWNGFVCSSEDQS